MGRGSTSRYLVETRKPHVCYGSSRLSTYLNDDHPHRPGIWLVHYPFLTLAMAPTQHRIYVMSATLEIRKLLPARARPDRAPANTDCQAPPRWNSVEAFLLCYSKDVQQRITGLRHQRQTFCHDEAQNNTGERHYPRVWLSQFVQLVKATPHMRVGSRSLTRGYPERPFTIGDNPLSRSKTFPLIADQSAVLWTISDLITPYYLRNMRFSNSFRKALVT